MKYKCTTELCIPIFDEDGFDTDEYGYVYTGSVWEIDNDTNIMGGEVHLDKISGQSDCTWIEVSKETLSKAFKMIK